MSEYAAFTLGSFIPGDGAQIEETGTDYGNRSVEFPFVNGSIEVSTGFKFRKWRARCLLCSSSIGEVATKRNEIRELVGSEHILNSCGEVFENVILVPSSLYFGRMKSTANGFIQEVEMDLKQLRTE